MSIPSAVYQIRPIVAVLERRPFPSTLALFEDLIYLNNVWKIPMEFIISASPFVWSAEASNERKCGDYKREGRCTWARARSLRCKARGGIIIRLAKKYPTLTSPLVYQSFFSEYPPSFPSTKIPMWLFWQNLKAGMPLPRKVQNLGHFLPGSNICVWMFFCVS